MAVVSLVIARYNEKLNWLIKSNIVHRDLTIYVYNKGNDDLVFLNAYPNVIVRRLENVGREGHTYYTHIVKHYNHLSSFIIFLQGEPFPHVFNAIDRINQCVNYAIHWAGAKHNHTTQYFHPIGEGLLYTHTRYTPFHRGLPLHRIVQFLFDIDYVGRIPFVSGAQFMVHKEIVHTRDVAFYSRIVDLLSISIDPLEGYAIERLHLPIFNLFSFSFRL